MKLLGWFKVAQQNDAEILSVEAYRQPAESEFARIHLCKQSFFIFLCASQKRGLVLYIQRFWQQKPTSKSNETFKLNSSDCCPAC